jgi:hypothetical protein
MHSRVRLLRFDCQRAIEINRCIRDRHRRYNSEKPSTYFFCLRGCLTTNCVQLILDELCASLRAVRKNLFLGSPSRSIAVANRRRIAIVEVRSAGALVAGVCRPIVNQFRINAHVLLDVGNSENLVDCLVAGFREQGDDGHITTAKRLRWNATNSCGDRLNSSRCAHDLEGLGWGPGITS